jgi:phage baseplate assembly protein W
LSFVVQSAYRNLPARQETSQPFRIDENGAVAIERDPGIWARDHILALVLTSMGERVMRPTYGGNLRAFVFENNDPFVESTLVVNIKSALAAFEPNITIMDIRLIPQPPDWSVFELDMTFTVGASPTRYSYQFSIPGQTVETQ